MRLGALHESIFWALGSDMQSCDELMWVSIYHALTYRFPGISQMSFKNYLWLCSTSSIYEDGDLSFRPRGGVCELFLAPNSGEWLDGPQKWRFWRGEVGGTKKQKIVEKYWKLLKLGYFSCKNIFIFWKFLNLKLGFGSRRG